MNCLVRVGIRLSDAREWYGVLRSLSAMNLFATVREARERREEW